MKRIWVDREKCLGCKSCELQCAIERDSVSKTLLGAVQEAPLPIARVGFSAIQAGAFPYSAAIARMLPVSGPVLPVLCAGMRQQRRYSWSRKNAGGAGCVSWPARLA